MIMGDRRKHPRSGLIQLAEADGNEPIAAQPVQIMGTTVDLSEGGLRFRGQEGFKEGSAVTIVFSVGEEIIEAGGRVAHYSPQDNGDIDMGIEFTHLSNRARSVIESYCRAKAKEPYETPTGGVPKKTLTH